MSERELGAPWETDLGPVRRFGRMGVIDTDQFAGRYYRCACGWEGWSTWGHAARHAASCELSDTPPKGFKKATDAPPRIETS